MLDEHEIYVLGRAAVDEIQDSYYRCVGTDIISMHPEKFILHLNAAIAKLERVKNFAIDYQKAAEKNKDETEW